VFTNKFSHAAWLTLAASMMASAQTPFVISNVHSALAMTDTPVEASQSTINQDTPTGGTYQQWVLHRPGTAIVYEIRSVANGNLLSVNVPSSGWAVIGNPLLLGTPEQLWQISRAAGSTGYEILSEVLQETSSSGSLPTYARLALDVPDFSTSAGEYIQEFKENDGTNQQWQFNPQDRTTILVTAFGSSIVITGYNFQANTRVCPVLESAVGLPQSVGSCISTGDGTFTYVYPVPGGYNFSSTGGYVVMAVEDQNGNVLAIGSAPGSYTAKL
jgi:hypothetical protein